MPIIKKSERLGKEKIGKLLIKLSVPAIIGMVIQSLYNIVDTIYVGKLSTEALSALSLAFPIQMIIIALGVGTGVGASSLISRLLGAGNKERAENAAEHVFFIAIIFGVVTAIVGGFFAEDIIKLFTDSKQLINLTMQYIPVIMIGSIAVYIPATFNYILRGEGNTVVPMITMIIGAVTNIILDPFLIFGIWIFPELGIAGAAYATIASRLLGGIFITKVLLSDKNELTLRLKYFKLDLKILKEIYEVGFPAMVNRLLFSFAFALINKILGTFNTTAIGVMGVIFRLQSFFMMAIFGLNQGFLPIVGYNYGHKNPKRMKRAIKLGGLTSLSFGTFGFLLFFLFPNTLLGIFNRNPEFLSIGVNAFRRVSFAYMFMSLNIIGVSTFQAMGRGFPSLALTVLRQMILLVPGIYILGNVVGLNSAWLSFPIAESITFIILSFWLYNCINKEVSLMKEYLV